MGVHLARTPLCGAIAVRRLFDPGRLPAGEPKEIALSRPAAHYASHVLRLSAGTEVCLFDADGRWCAGLLRWEERGAERGAGYLGECTWGVEAPSPLRIDLWAGLIRPHRWDWLLEKSTELGVDAIVPLACDHSVVRVPAEKAEARRERWQRQVGEASKQCGRRQPPGIGPPVTVQVALGAIAEQSVGVLLDECAPPGKVHLLDLLHGASVSNVIVATGPEGGWSERERCAFRERGFAVASLGVTTLRAETAPLACLVLLQHWRGHL